ncbi:MAG: hypothetical protein KatS3mg103_1090 [Phycisphaerales bacterium]|nr:MAG: hypothetical protein KatS3mg103_1090 [Phycisphaerales bacterium]
MNIIDTGSGRPLEAGGVVQGRPSPGLLAQTGLTEQDLANIRASLASLAETTERTSRLLARLEPRLEEAVGQVGGAVEEVRAVTAEVRERLPAIGDAVEGTLAQARDGVQRWSELSDRLDQRTEALAQAALEITQMVQAQRPAIERVLADLESITSQADQRVLPAVVRAAEDVQQASAHGRSAAMQAEALLEAEAPGIRRTLANLRLASDQAKLTMLEVRRSPWRLLHRPSTRELEGELVYDAARAFAQAASDLRAASESLLALSTDEQGPVDLADRRAAIDRLAEELRASFQRYRQAEQALLDRALGLGAGEPAGPSAGPR